MAVEFSILENEELSFDIENTVLIRGPRGYSITRVEKISGTHAAGTLDTYRVYIDNGDTDDFEVYNGKDAYTYAVAAGYEGTEAEFAELMGHFAEYYEAAEDAAETAEAAAQRAESAEDNTEAAKSAAQTAAGVAESAKTEAVSAKNTAVNASGAAQSYATSAESAKNTAVSASQTATAKSGEAASSAADASISAQAAAQSAQSAAASERNASSSETAAAESERQAGLSKNAAAVSETNAEQSAAAASTSATNAAESELAAQGYAEDAAEIVSNIIDDTLSVTGKAADAKVVGDRISDLKSALNLTAGSLNGEIFEDQTQINRISNTDNYYMDASGTNIYDINYVTDKYAVTSGTLLHLRVAKDSNYVWAFRDGLGFSSTVIGTVERVGGSLYVTVPIGATHLFVSRLKTTISNTVFTAKSVVSENTQNIEKNAKILKVIEKAINAKYQYLDSTLWESKKYYTAANATATVEDTGYAIYSPFTVPAGTYNYSRINFEFSYASSNSQASYKPFTTTAGTITFAEETTLYLTCQFPTTDYTQCMFANWLIPPNYVFGLYINKSIKIVDLNGGGDYLTIQDAINDCKDLDQYNVQTGVHETIVVYPGIYPRFSMGAGGNNVIARRNISIIGIDRQKCIIRDDEGLYKYPPAEIRTDGTIANLTFIATHNNGDVSTAESKDQYAVHLDYGYCEETFENCTFISYCNAAVGIGLYANEKLTFRNCTFESYADPSEWGGNAPYGIYCHTNTTDGTANQNLTLIDCECISEYSQYGGVFQIIANTGNSTQFLKLIRNLFYGNNGFSVNIQNGWDTSMSYGNSVEV